MIATNKDKLNRHIAFISDNNYVFPTSIAIYSLVSNLCKDKEHKYFIHVFSFDLTKENNEKLTRMGRENSNVIIHCINVKEYEHIFKTVNQKTHVTPTALLKFELANLLPECEEVLYLDGDIIVKGNIATIFDYDITGYALAASFEFWTYLMKLFEFDGDSELPEFSFNSGVMLLNLKYFRENRIDKQLWKTKFDSCNQAKKKENMMDQTTLNIVLANRCVHLPIKYNCNNQFTEGVDISYINKAFKASYNNSEELKNDAVIVHYVGKKEKPWIYTGVRFQGIWDYYCKQYGVNPDYLNRHKFKKDIKYYVERLVRSLEVRGLRKTLIYLYYKKDVKL